VAQTGNNERDIGFGNVADRLINLSRKWGGMWRFDITADRDGAGRPRLFVVLERRRVDRDDNTDASTRVWTPFPGPHYGSFAANLYRLCDVADERLEAKRIERESQTAF
jgi:hypothetical protein